MTEPDIAALLRFGGERLATSSDTPRLDAEVLLAHVLGQSRSHLYTWPERIPDAAAQTAYRALLERRRQGEPVAHLTGRRAFWTLELRVTPDTMIPRPESELLIALALERLPASGKSRIADLGTGSGALALALARERPGAEIIGVDNSAAALAVARDNARRLGLDHTHFVQGDWCGALAAEQFDLIVANPPYVATDSPWLQQGDVRFDPPAALIAGHDGLDAIRRIVAQAPRVLKSGGWLLIEHGFDQGKQVGALLQERGFDSVECHSDEAGQDRVGSGRRPG